MPKARNPKGASSQKVIEERVAEAITILANRPQLHKATLHRELTTRWNCHWRTVDRTLARAREEMFKRMNRTKEEFRMESLTFYEAKMADPKATVSEQLRARQCVDQLLGLNAPSMHQITTPAGQPLQVEDVSEMPKLSKTALVTLITRLTGETPVTTGSYRNGGLNGNGNGHSHPPAAATEEAAPPQEPSAVIGA